MPKSVFMRIVLISASALIIVGVSLLGWMLATSGDRNVIKIELENGKTETVEFKELALVPGSSCEYKIKLKGENAKKYELILDFVEKGKAEENTLKNFAYVKIVSNGSVICDELLATALERDDITLHVDFKEKKNTELTVIFYLPIDVGNEAKNSAAVFELLLTAINE